jgi:hypothetical protein
MISRPQTSEAAPYYFTYISQAGGPDYRIHFALEGGPSGLRLIGGSRTGVGTRTGVFAPRVTIQLRRGTLEAWNEFFGIGGR